MLQAYTLSAFRYPPLHDLPVISARHHLEAQYLRGESSPFYRVHYSVIPNLGSDVVVPVLMNVMPPLAATKLFVMLSGFLFWAGPATYIVVANGRRPGGILSSLLLLPLVWGSLYPWGFLNWYSGIGLTFLVLSHHHWLAGREKTNAGQYVLHAALVSMLFVWHLSAWFIYGLVAGCRVAVVAVGLVKDQRSWRGAFSLIVSWVATTVPSMALLAIYKLDAKADFAVDPRLGYEWGSWGGKLVGLMRLFMSYDRGLDIFCGLLWIAASVAWFRPDAGSLRRSAAPLVPVVVLLLAYLIMPSVIGATGASDVRLLPALLVCCLVVLGGQRVRWPALGAILLALCLIARHVEIYRAWGRIDAEHRNYARLFLHFSPGDRVLPVAMLPGWGQNNVDRFFHGWAVAERGIFIPDLAVFAGSFPLRKIVPCEQLATIEEADSKGKTVRIDDFPSLGCYDFLWVMNRVGAHFEAPDGFELLEERGALAVWKRRQSPTSAVSGPRLWPQ